MRRTVIGSFWKLDDDPETAIRKAVDLQVRHGIDLVTDGEQRYDMIQYFHQFPGLEKTRVGVRIIGRIQPLPGPSDFIKVNDYKFVRKYLDANGHQDTDIKTTITGPVTLGFSCGAHGIKDHYKNVMDLQIYTDMADALRPLAVQMLEMGSYVQFDEPGISAGFIQPDQAVKTLDYLLSGIPENYLKTHKVSVHMCGSLAKPTYLVDLVLKTRTPILSFAFAGRTEKENINLFTKELLSKHEKRLGVGCVPVSPTSLKDVDTSETVKSRVEQIVTRLGVESIAYFHPDCGMKSTPLDVTDEILARMKISTDPFLSR